MGRLKTLEKYAIAVGAGAVAALSINYRSSDTRKNFLQELKRQNYHLSISTDGTLITKYFCEKAPYSPSAHTIADLKPTLDGRLILDIRHTGYLSFHKCDRAFMIEPGARHWVGGTTLDQDKADIEDPEKLKQIARKYPIEIKDEYAEAAAGATNLAERTEKVRGYIRDSIDKRTDRR